MTQVVCIHAGPACQNIGTDPETGEIIECHHATPHERRVDCPPQYCPVAQMRAPCVRFERVEEDAANDQDVPEVRQ